MLQAAMFDGDAFDAGALGEDGFVPAEVGVCGCHVAQAFMVTLVIIVLDENPGSLLSANPHIVRLEWPCCRG